MGKIKETINNIRSWLGFPTGYYGTYGYYAPYNVFTPSETIPFVSPTNALTYTPVYRAVNLISSDIARTPAEFTNPNLQRIWERPNRWQSGFDFIRSLTAQALLYGNAFALINRKKNGEIYELLPLPVGSVSLDVSGPEPIYKSNIYGSINPDSILHIKAGLVEGLWSESPVSLCRTAIVVALNQENNAKTNAENGGLPNLAIVHPSQLNAAARQAIANDYMKNHTGKNAGRPIVLAENVRLEKLTSTSVASDLEAARKYSIADVSRIYGIPMSYLSETSGSVYGSMEWLSRMYLDSCLAMWYETWKAEFMLKFDEEPLFDTDFVIRPSLAETFSALRTGIEAGILTRNEAREILDYEMVEGGDEFLTALNLGQGGGQTNLGTDTSGGVAQGDVING